MRILLDENLPESLVAALRRLGHHVESVNSLRLKGLDNSTLYQQVAQDYDLCFTKSLSNNRRERPDKSGRSYITTKARSHKEFY